MTVSPAPVTSAISSLPKMGTNVASPPRSNKGQPLRPARDEEAPRAQTLEELPAGLLDRLVPVERRPQELLDLRLARGRGREVVESEEVVPGVGRHDDPALTDSPDLREDARRDRAVPVVRQDHRVDVSRVGVEPLDSSVSIPGGIAPSGSRSTRTICWRAEREPHPPPRIRVLTGVGRGRHPDDAVSRNAAIEQRAPDRLSCRIRPHHSQRDDLRPQSVEIVARVRRPPQTGLLGEVSQDQHGGFPGDALGLAEHVFVGHQVADHQDTATLEPPDHPEEVGDLRATHGRVSRRFGSWGRALATCNSSAPLY